MVAGFSCHMVDKQLQVFNLKAHMTNLLFDRPTILWCRPIAANVVYVLDLLHARLSFYGEV
jgi:hypothetical protein